VLPNSENAVRKAIGNRRKKSGTRGALGGGHDRFAFPDVGRRRRPQAV
jgi:hypothetical protein